ncbi:unnamed protein product [Prunus armeniaca]
MPLSYSAHAPPHAPAARGCPKRYPSPENFQIVSPDSYPRYPTLKIDAILPNHQLDHAEGMNFHTLIAKNGGRTTENEAGEVSGETELFSSIFRRNLDG